MSRHRFALASLVSALLLAASGASAQGQALEKLAGTTPQQRAGIQTMFLKSKLGLSAEQAQKLEAINLKYAQQMQPILESSERPLMKMGQVHRVEEAKDAEMRQLLSPEQYSKYQASKEELREHLEQKVMEKRQGGGS